MPNWVNPKNNWQVNDIMTAQDANVVADDLRYLYERDARAYTALEPDTTDSTSSFETLASLEITTRGGDMLVGFYAPVTHNNSGMAYFDIAINGTRYALDTTNGSLAIKPGASGSPTVATLSLLLLNVAADTHTLDLQWRTDTATLSSGYGQFWVLEV